MLALGSHRERGWVEGVGGGLISASAVPHRGTIKEQEDKTMVFSKAQVGKLTKPDDTDHN